MDLGPPLFCGYKIDVTSSQQNMDKLSPCFWTLVTYIWLRTNYYFISLKWIFYIEKIKILTAIHYLQDYMVVLHSDPYIFLI